MGFLHSSAQWFLQEVIQVFVRKLFKGSHRKFHKYSFESSSYKDFSKDFFLKERIFLGIPPVISSKVASTISSRISLGRSSRDFLQYSSRKRFWNPSKVSFAYFSRDSRILQRFLQKLRNWSFNGNKAFPRIPAEIHPSAIPSGLSPDSFGNSCRDSFGIFSTFTLWNKHFSVF